MRFEEVMKFLLYGFKARRVSWDSDVYIKFNKFGKLIRYNGDDVGVYPVNINDVNEYDWIYIHNI